MEPRWGCRTEETSWGTIRLARALVDAARIWRPVPPPPPLRGCNVVARPSIESSGVDAMQAYGVGGGSEGRRRSAATENRNRSRLGPNGE